MNLALRLVTSCVLMVGLPVWFLASQQARAELRVSVQPVAASLPRYAVFELGIVHSGAYNNRFFDVSLKGAFTSPGGRQVVVKGFYEAGETWKLRFVPVENGTWSYRYTLESAAGAYSGEGFFEVTEPASDGPVHRHPQNPFRWRFATGRPYFPVGLQDCVGLSTDGRLAPFSIDGEGRNDPEILVPANEYLALYGQAGFNLLRFSHDNCSFKLFDDLEHYREPEIAATEELLTTARANGYRILFGFFGFAQGEHPEWNGAYVGAALSEGERRFIDYCVARWGAYVDFWELTNERLPPDNWLTEAAEHVRSVDPSKKPVSTSWERPGLQAIDMNAPHWFESESELDSDLRVAQQALEWKRFGKPVVAGEQGNTGQNWDSLSALRMRIRLWTALFQEVTIVFWNTSWSKAGMNQGVYVPGSVANIYLGPEERGYVSALERFSSRVDADTEMAPVALSSPDVRGYALASADTTAVYLHHFANHTEPVRGLRVAVESRLGVAGLAEWIDPASGAVLLETQVPAGSLTLTAPDFTVDLALIIKRVADAPAN